MRKRATDQAPGSRKWLPFPVLVAAIGAACVLLPGLAVAQPAPDANSVLILSSLDTSGFYAARAAAMGLTVVNATGAQWAARTTADFATFKALILPDPDCVVGTSPITVPTANNSVWAPAIDGPILVIGTDEFFHETQGGLQLINSGLSFVTSGSAGQTGLYASLSCYYDGSPAVPVPLLAPFGSFTAADAPGCFNDVHIVAVHPALSGSTDATLSNWSCSVHEIFTAFPSSTFLPLAIARNVTGPGSLTFADGSTGVPYILASGGGISPVLCGNGVIEPPEQCDDGNTTSGDGCSSFCTIEGVTPTPTPTSTPTPVPVPAIVPTLSFPMMVLLGLALGAAGFVLMRRL